MEYQNDMLRKIDLRKSTLNKQYSKWYYLMSEMNMLVCDTDTGELINCNEIDTKKYKSKSDRIGQCLDLWVWDKYDKNKLLDLQKVNRCKNNRFCPNCRLMDISKFIHKFKDILSNYMSIGYVPYMLTLTIPNCDGNGLEDTLKRLSDAFLMFQRRYKPDSNKTRLISIDGGIRVLEITHNQFNDTYHPHYHCMILVKGGIDDNLMLKNIKGRYSKKRKSYNYKSILDNEISLYWTMLYNKISITKNNIKGISDQDLYECDLRPMDKGGFYEVFKYTFKDTDIHNFRTFATLEIALNYKRLRQGFGCLYNVQCENVEVGEYQELILEYEESPEILLTTEISELYNVYKSYKKVSRFNNNIINNNIKE